jgi:hypothetical protein
MADLGFDGMISVWWVPTIADITAPKAATEINAGGSVALHPRLTPDGLATGAGSDTIDTSKLASTFNTKIVGRRNFDGLQLTYVRGDSTPEKLLDTTLVYKASGYIVVRRGVVSMQADGVTPAPAVVADKVEVYPAQCGEPQYASPAPNALQTVVVPLTLTRDPRSSSNPATVAT